jgi:hypothetical protein
MHVKIRTWKDMEDEYGLDKNGCIKIAEGFTDLMEECLPDNREIEITEIEDSDLYVWRLDFYTFTISMDMIENNNYIKYLKLNNINLEDI